MGLLDSVKMSVTEDEYEDEVLVACKNYDKCHGTNTVLFYREMKKKNPNWKDTDVVFDFDRGAFFAGYLKYKFYSMGDALLFMSYTGNDFCGMKEYCFCFPFDGIKKVANLISNLNWEKKYECEDIIYDGYGWGLKLHYDDVEFESDGYEAYPKNFKKKIKQLQKHIEKLCAKYAPYYEKNGIDERLRL